MKQAFSILYNTKSITVIPKREINLLYKSHQFILQLQIAIIKDPTASQLSSETDAELTLFHIPQCIKSTFTKHHRHKTTCNIHSPGLFNEPKLGTLKNSC